jgi:glucose-1-phosphate thymidylyltransferase
MKGIILAGGKGTRLYPATKVVCKQLLPIYDKPLIYYPLSVLMLAGIKEILIISTPEDIGKFKNLFSDGSQLGLKIEYKVQEQPRGLADAFIVGESFIGKDECCLILGDNIFFGQGLSDILKKAAEKREGATIFGYHVRNPEIYGVVDFDSKGNVLSIEEKPKKPKSNYAVVGLYFYDNKVINMAKNLKPSARGEIEITDLNNEYLKKGKLKVEFLGRGFAWLDTGSFEAMSDASDYIRALEERQGQKIGCIEEIAYSQGYIDEEQLRKLAEPLKSSGYGAYLLGLME